jgi:hypothetical protein
MSGTSATRDCKAVFYASVLLPTERFACTLVSAYVEATNSFDLEGLLATFADDAPVNDQLRDYWRKPAIGKWACKPENRCDELNRTLRKLHRYRKCRRQV